MSSHRRPAGTSGDPVDPAVCSEPLETEDGQEVVICQQNVGYPNQVGGGEFKEAVMDKPSEQAAAEQAALEEQAPVAGDGYADPDLSAPSTKKGHEIGLDRFLGKVPLAVCLAGSLDDEATVEVVRSFDEHLADFGRARIQALVVLEDGADAIETHARQHGVNVPLLADPDRSWAEHLGVERSPGRVDTALVSVDGRVVEVLSALPGGTLAEEVLTRTSTLPQLGASS
jgi:peroxiredoxin